MSPGCKYNYVFLVICVYVLHLAYVAACWVNSLFWTNGIREASSHFVTIAFPSIHGLGADLKLLAGIVAYLALICYNSFTRKPLPSKQKNCHVIKYFLT